jgi:hypothetical protein
MSSSFEMTAMQQERSVSVCSAVAVVSQERYLKSSGSMSHLHRNTPVFFTIHNPKYTIKPDALQFDAGHGARISAGT